MLTILLTICLGLVMGIVFGIALEKSRVFEPGIIIGQFQFRNFIMLKVFLTAIMTSLIVFAVFFGLGYERLNWKVTIYGADIVGGLLLGIGIALAGACPGTLFAQIGAGYKDAIATFFGGLAGAMAFIIFHPVLSTYLLNGQPHQKLTLDMLLNLSFTSTALIVLGVFAVILVLLERYRPWKQDLGNNADGLK